MEIKVVGAGCSNCKKLLNTVKDAVSELGIDAQIVYVTDMAEIMKTGILSTPGMLIDGKVRLMGRVPALKEVKQIISDNMIPVQS